MHLHLMYNKNHGMHHTRYAGEQLQIQRSETELKY